MESLGRQVGEREFFVRTPEFEPLKGPRNPESDRWARGDHDNPQVLGIVTVFEGRVFNPNLYIRHKGSQRIFVSISN